MCVQCVLDVCVVYVCGCGSETEAKHGVLFLPCRFCLWSLLRPRRYHGHLASEHHPDPSDLRPGVATLQHRQLRARHVGEFPNARHLFHETSHEFPAQARREAAALHLCFALILERFSLTVH